MALILGTVLAAGGVALLLSDQFGSQVATAKVGGLEYVVAGARGLDVPAGLVSEYGSAASIKTNIDVEGTDVYSIDGIDPALVLLMKLQPGARDDAGLLGDYAVLIRGSGFAQLCPYFDVPSEAAPTVCK